MKHALVTLIAFSITLWLIRCNQATAEKSKPTAPQIPHTPTAPVEGTWKLVWATYNDTLANLSNHVQVKMFVNGAFSLLAHDTSGRIKYASYGTYQFEGNTYHETFLYHNNTPFIGGEDWQNLSVKGDTMYLDGLTKVVVGGKDVTASWRKVREKLVRVDW